MTYDVTPAHLMHKYRTIKEKKVNFDNFNSIFYKLNLSWRIETWCPYKSSTGKLQPFIFSIMCFLTDENLGGQARFLTDFKKGDYDLICMYVGGHIGMSVIF